MQLRELLEAKGFVRVPMKKLKTGHYKIRMHINGVSGNFIVDTGASTSCVGVEFTDLFIFKNEESDVKASGAGATNIETQVARNNIVAIATKKIRDVAIILFDLSHVNSALEQAEELPVHGILGADILKETRCVLDYGRNCLYII